ncbi:RcnB family protein [Lentibacter algarum]|uniref:RcnB family protein n=1 Tax=Lentibacter algarum TaxID=576131 RepID=UPI001C06FCFF|nr:RcnB family protein [Lentibacter algarum]MBU2982337.1 RcnB family protein [Lentibacter algarum]
MNRISIALIASLAMTSFAAPAFAKSDKQLKHSAVAEQAQRETRKTSTKQRTKVHSTQRTVTKTPQRTTTRTVVKHTHVHANRHNAAVVKDWNKRGLRRPAQGHVYVEQNGDLFLVLATSLLVQALSN